ncbi:hypothetical protein D3C72_1238930 [compost metagenome]
MLAHGFLEHLACAAQQRVAVAVAVLVVDLLQAIEVHRHHADRPRPLAAQARQLVLVIGAVVELGQHVVLAQELHVGFRLFARGDVGQRHQHLVPVCLPAREDRPLHEHVHRAAIERVVDDFALLPELFVPEVDQLLGKVDAHVVAEHVAQPGQQDLLARRGEHRQRLLVDVEHADFLHAARDEVRVHIQKRPKIGDAGRAYLVQQHLHRAEVLHPERDRRVLEQPLGVLLAAAQVALAAHARGDVLDRQQHARPVLLVAGHDRGVEADVQPFAVERVVDGLAGEVPAAVPELTQFLDVLVEHVVTEHGVEVGDEVRQVGGAEEVERAAVDVEHADQGRAARHFGRALAQIGAQVGHPARAQLVEGQPHGAEVLKPERDRRELEQRLIIVVKPRSGGCTAQVCSPWFW